VSRVPARHSKPSRSSARTSTRARVGPQARQRKRSLITAALRHKPAWAAVTVAGLALIAAAGLAVPHWLGQAPRATAMNNAGGPSAGPVMQLSGQAGGRAISNAMTRSSRPRSGHIHKRRHGHARPQTPAQPAPAQPAPAQPAPAQPTPSSGGSGSVTRHTDCLASPHSCGFPDATNTGADCSSLTPSGSITVTTNGTVISGKNVTGQIAVRASNVTIENTCVRSSTFYPIDFTSGSNLTIRHVTVTGSGDCQRAVEPEGNGVIMDAMNVSGCIDGVQMSSNDVLENSYIHDLLFPPGSHNDGVQQNGGSHDVVRHNTILNPHNQTSCVNFTTDFGPISDITITGNLLNGGNYTVYSRAGWGDGSNPTGVSVTDNHFGSADVFGLLTADGSVAWSGNVSDATGQTVGR